MSGIWARTLVYLGLREEPDDHVEWDVLEAATGEVPPAPVGRDRGAGARPVVRPPDPPVADVRPLRATAPTGAVASPPADRVTVVQVRAFDDVEAAGAGHRAGRPVLIDISACEAPTDRRVIDFVAGMTFASGGTFRRVSRGGYLLLPRGVALSPVEQERLARLGFPVEGGPR